MELTRTKFKQTEVGLIPEDWALKSIDDVVKISTGSKNTQDKISDGKYPFYVRSQTVERINSFSYDCEAVLTVGDGVGTGKVFHYINEKFELHQRVYIMNEFVNDLDGYYFYLFFSNYFYGRVMQMTAKSSVDSVRRDMIADMKIPLPPLPEQKAIAQVLRNTDNLIQAIELKLTKKRAIKQGSMQKLLTPKNDWEIKKLGTISHFYNGKAHEQFIDANGNYKVINSKFVSTGGKVFKSANVNICPLKKGDITMVMSDIPNGKALAKCFLVPADDKYTLNQRICAIRTEEVDTEFLYFILNRNKYYLAFDSGTGQTNLKKNDVLECPIPLPKTKVEQTEIATILIDMNKEISQLEQKLSKYKMLKQGLMQNLLTGKIRLV